MPVLGAGLGHGHSFHDVSAQHHHYGHGELAMLNPALIGKMAQAAKTALSSSKTIMSKVTSKLAVTKPSLPGAKHFYPDEKVVQGLVQTTKTQLTSRTTAGAAVKASSKVLGKAVSKPSVASSKLEVTTGGKLASKRGGVVSSKTEANKRVLFTDERGRPSVYINPEELPRMISSVKAELAHKTVRAPHREHLEHVLQQLEQAAMQLPPPSKLD